MGIHDLYHSWANHHIECCIASLGTFCHHLNTIPSVACSFLLYRFRHFSTEEGAVLVLLPHPVRHVPLIGSLFKLRPRMSISLRANSLEYDSHRRAVRTMTLKAIPLPHLRLGARQGGLELSLQSSMTVDFPHSFENVGSVDDLTRATNEEHLWIARLGCSRLTISLTNLAKPFCASDSEAVAEWIQGHQVWLLTFRRLRRS